MGYDHDHEDEFIDTIDPHAVAADGGGELLFNAVGHGTIGIAALLILDSEQPAARVAIEDLLARDPLGRSDMPIVARWPDDIRNQHPETRDWHFVTLLYREGQPRDPIPAGSHVISRLQEQVTVLANAASDEEKVSALAWVTHLVGDIHQPLHCCSRVNQFHPNGDKGGNGFELSGKWKNLHSLWDASVNLLGGNDIDGLAADLIEEHTRASLAPEVAETRFEQWAIESYHLSVTNVYRGLIENPDDRPRPSSRYVRKAMVVGQRRAALAAYRLADLLKPIFA